MKQVVPQADLWTLQHCWRVAVAALGQAPPLTDQASSRSSTEPICALRSRPGPGVDMPLGCLYPVHVCIQTSLEAMDFSRR